MRSGLRVVCMLAIAGMAVAPTAGVPAAEPSDPPRFEAVAFSLLGGLVTGEVRIPSAPAGPRPAILQPLVAEEMLLARGFAVVRFHTDWTILRSMARVIPPAAREGAKPGRGVGKWLLASPGPEVVGRPYFQLIGADAASTVPAVLDHLERFPEIDPARIGIAGSSTAGFVALEALLHDRRISAAAVRVACGDYHEFLRSSDLALGGGELALDPAYDANLRKREPFRFADLYPPRAVLMQNGALDPAIPVACARRTAAAFEEAYARRGLSERFRFVVYGDRSHDLGPEAAAEALRWWERWLLPEGHQPPLRPPAENAVR